MTGHGLAETRGPMTGVTGRTVGTGPRPTVQNQTAQSSGAACQHNTVFQITDLESGVHWRNWTSD